MTALPATISRLKVLRISHNMVLQELSIRANVAVSTIVSIEKWGHIATLDTYDKLAKVFGVSVEEVMRRDEIHALPEPPVCARCAEVC